MSNLFSEKSLLAKLMAEENIIIEQRPVETASFSLESRVLTIPTFDESVSSEILDVLFSHEIAHAKYTPTDDWLDVLMNKASYEDETSIPKGILNVVEDARIERLIKNKYPGLKPSYIKGYNELIELGLFGEKIKNDEISEFKFIDKMNIFFKIGHIRNYDYEFNEIETDLVKEVSKAETFDDVIQVSRKISTYLKNEWQYEKSESEFEFELEILAELSSEIEEEFEKNKFNLYSSDYITYVDIFNPEFDDIVIDYKVLYERLADDNVAGATFSKSNFIKFKRKYNSVVSYLVKEFELRKNADQFKKTKISNSGDINLDKLFSYRFTDNIFKKISIAPNAKSHGLVFFLDWSASMEFIMEETIKQLLCLVLFCQKCNIPYEVFAFSSYYGDYEEKNNKFFEKYRNSENLIVDTVNVNLLNILSNRMSASDFNIAANTLLGYNHHTIRYEIDEISYTPSYFKLGSTPLNAAIINGIDVVNQFKKNYKLQIVNTVILTDGESNEIELFKCYNKNNTRWVRIGIANLNKRSVFRYKKYREMESFSCKQNRNWKVSRLGETNLFLNIFKKCTGSNVTGFYVMPKKHIKLNADVFFTQQEYDSKLKEFRNHNCTSIQNYGFDDYHLIKYDMNFSFDDESDFEFNSNNSAKAIAKKFSSHLGKKLENRIILQKFIQRIS